MPNKETKKEAAARKEHERAVKTVAKGAGIAFIGLFLGKLFAYLTRLFIARSLGPEAYGLISMGIAIISFLATFALLGFSPGLTRFIAFHRGKKEMGKVKGGIKSAFKISIPLSILFGALLFIFSEPVSLFFSKPELSIILKILSLSIPFYIIMYISFSTLLGFKLVKYKVYIVDIGKNLSTLIFVALLFYLGMGVFGTASGFALGFLCSSIIGIFYIRKKAGPKMKGQKIHPAAKEILKFSIPLLLTSFSLLIMSWTDVLMLGYFDTAANVGIYEAALNTCVLLTFFKTSFGFIILPQISELYSNQKIEEIKNIYSISTKWLFFMIFPIFLLFILFPDKVLGTLFGSNFIIGSVSLTILSIGYLFVSIFDLPYYIITSMGKVKINFYFTLLAAIFNFLLNLFLIPIYGILGAGVAMTISVSLRPLLSSIYFYRETGIILPGIGFLKSFFASTISVIITYLIITHIFRINNTILLIGLLLFLLLYVFLVILFKSIEKDDIIIIKSIEKKTNIELKWLKNIIKKFV